MKQSGEAELGEGTVDKRRRRRQRGTLGKDEEDEEGRRGRNSGGKSLN